MTARAECPFSSIEELRQAVVQAGSVTRLSVQLNVARNMPYIWAQRLGGDIRKRNRVVDLPELSPPEEDAAILKLLKKQPGLSVPELADMIDCSPRRVRESIERLQHGGFRLQEGERGAIVLERVAPAPSDSITPLDPGALWRGDWVRFAVISDTHLGSLEHKRGELEAAYRMIADEGISVVYHGGDLVDGSGIYPHQVRAHAPGAHTFEGQIRMAVEQYPRVEGIQTYVIGGNHDLEGNFGRMGADPVQAICNQREDLHYLGPYSAFVELPNGAFMHVLHGKAGNSYAKSYRLQKLAEAYESGKKPAILAVGHYHGRCVVRWRSVEVVMLGSFQGSTEFATRSGMGPPEIGFHVFEACLADDGSLVRFRPEWFAIFTGRHMIEE